MSNVPVPMAVVGGAGGLKRTGSLSTASLSSLQASKSSSMESLESSMSVSEGAVGQYSVCVCLCMDIISMVLFLVCVDVDNHRLTTVLQENAVLKSEIEMLKTKYKSLMEENKRLKQASVTIVRILLLLLE